MNDSEFSNHLSKFLEASWLSKEDDGVSLFCFGNFLYLNEVLTTVIGFLCSSTKLFFVHGSYVCNINVSVSGP